MRPIEDDGHAIVATKPFRPGRRVYSPDKLPDPAQCGGCLILVNDRHDANRLRLALSDGSSWRMLVFEDQLPTGRVVPSVDLAALAREQVALAVRSLPQQPAPAVRMIEAQPQQPSENIAPLAAAVLEMSEHVNMLLSERVDLMARVEFLEKHAIAAARIEAA